MTGVENKTERKLYVTHISLLMMGFLVGLAAAYVVSGIPFDFSSELATAKRLGIVSLTILNDYPKNRDIIQYAALVVLPVLCAISFWWVWARSRCAELKGLLYGDMLPPLLHDRNWRWSLLGVGLFILYATFNINMLNGSVGGWSFLAEMGEYLAWAQFILDGGVYARDFFCLYGPLMVYPPAWAMKFFGATISTYWGYGYMLSLVTYGLLLFFLYQTIRNRAVFIGSALFCLLIGTSLRFVLGIVPVLILYTAIEKKKKLPVLTSGIVLALSLLFSQEAGLCGGIAIALFLLLEARQGGFRILIRQTALVAVGCLGVLLPVLAYFYVEGALGRFFDNLYGYPKLVTLGYAALPFPEMKHFLAEPFSSGAYYPFWIISVYIFSAISIIITLCLKPGSRDTHIRAAVLIFGLFLYRVALGRSDSSHIHNSSLPAFLLTFLMIDDLVRVSPLALVNGVRKVQFALVLMSVVLLLGASNKMRNNAADFIGDITSPVAKFSREECGIKLPELPRGDICFDQTTANDLKKIRGLLDRHTREGEEVLFFPNEPAYYFMFNRRCPTRYVLAYFTASSAQRMEMVTELEQHRPVYVVYSLDTYRIDNIPETVQVPEVFFYLQEKYAVEENLGNIVLLKRKKST